MKKTSFYKRTIQNLGIFIFLAVLLAIFIVPNYNMLFASKKNDMIEEFDADIKQQLKMMENEINLQKTALTKMVENEDFKILSNPSAYGYTTNSVEWFESRDSVQKSFESLNPMVMLQDKSMLMFRNGDLQIDINGAVGVFRTGYDTMWNMSYKGEVYSFDAASAQIFMKMHSGKFDGLLCYNDLAEQQSYELFYGLTLAASDDVSNCTFVACYDAEKLVEQLGFADDTASVLLVTGETNRVYSHGDEYDLSVYDSVCQSDSINLKIYYSISDTAIRNRLEPINSFLIIFVLGFVFLGLLATGGISLVETRHIKKLISVTEGTTDVEYSGEDDYFKYLETIFHSLHDKSNKATDSIKGLIFSKMLNFRLSNDEMQIIAEYFDSPLYVVMLKATETKYHNLEYDVSSYLKRNNIEIIHIEKIENSEVLVFVKKTASVREAFEDMVMSLNKELHTDIRGVVAVCEDAEQMTAIYRKIRKNIPYLEYGSLKNIDVDSVVFADADFKTFMAKSRQLYEIIRSGNEFEAKRTVYEQWYKITQGEIQTSAVEPLFFSQSIVLSQIVSDYKLNIAIPRFDSAKDAVSIAFEITGCIEQICEKMKGSPKKEDVRSSQIIDYIEQRYCDASFYMPELVGKFELSDRAIVQILKKATGDNFSNYLSKLRISKAQELLATTDIAIAEVAVASGFDSSNSLYKAFKKVCGVSPSVYRESRKTQNKKEE